MTAATLAEPMPSSDCDVHLLGNVDFRNNHNNSNNLYIVALSMGFGLLPLVAPRWSQQMPHALQPLLESGILLTSLSAVLLSSYFNGSREDRDATIAAARTAEAH